MAWRERVRDAGCKLDGSVVASISLAAALLRVAAANKDETRVDHGDAALSVERERVGKAIDAISSCSATEIRSEGNRTTGTGSPGRSRVPLELRTESMNVRPARASTTRAAMSPAIPARSDESSSASQTRIAISEGRNSTGIDPSSRKIAGWDVVATRALEGMRVVRRPDFELSQPSFTTAFGVVYSSPSLLAEDLRAGRQALVDKASARYHFGLTATAFNKDFHPIEVPVPELM